MSKQMPNITLRPYCTDSQVVEVVHMHSEGVTSFEFLTLMVDIQGLPYCTYLFINFRTLRFESALNSLDGLSVCALVTIQFL